MARSYNHVVLVGNLGRDPEKRALPSGKSVLSFSLATSRSYKDASGNWVENTDWHKIDMFGLLADRGEKVLSKGKNILVEGEVRNENYEKNGVKFYGYKIFATNFVLLENKQSETRYSDSQSSEDFDTVNDASQSDDEDDDLPF